MPAFLSSGASWSARRVSAAARSLFLRSISTLARKVMNAGFSGSSLTSVEPTFHAWSMRRECQYAQPRLSSTSGEPGLALDSFSKALTASG
ncbi:MAG: hypothetical protein M0D55_05400 [Elusimicrobiota bacterium]|nr:MAG: hypothetical protein M0D55_05400 [Elusimicrobiota bacterium]